MKVSMYNIEGKESSDLDVSEEVFGVEWNPDLVHQAFVAQRSNRRQKAAHAKGRSEVSGGGRKPWRQKGTGRARHGSIRSPLWKGGGVTFGPNKNRNQTKSINKKMKRKALLSLLSKKHEEGEVKFVESFGLDEYKTKTARTMLENMIGDDRMSVLLIASDEHKDIKKAVKNIQGVDAISVKSLNVSDILSYKFIAFEESALIDMDSHFSRKEAVTAQS